MGHSSVHVHVIMYTTQGHCVGVEPLYICMNEGSSPLVCDADGRMTSGLVFVPVELNVLMR